MGNPITKIDLDLYKGSTYRHKINVLENGVAKDLTGFTAEMEIRSRNGTLLHSSTTANGELTVDASGFIEIMIDGVDIYGWSFKKGYYDLFVYDVLSDPYAICRGTVEVHASQTNVTD